MPVFSYENEWILFKKTKPFLIWTEYRTSTAMFFFASGKTFGWERDAGLVVRFLRTTDISTGPGWCQSHMKSPVAQWVLFNKNKTEAGVWQVNLATKGCDMKREVGLVVRFTRTTDVSTGPDWCQPSHVIWKVQSHNEYRLIRWNRGKSLAGELSNKGLWYISEVVKLPRL